MFKVGGLMGRARLVCPDPLTAFDASENHAGLAITDGQRFIDADRLAVQFTLGRFGHESPPLLFCNGKTLVAEDVYSRSTR